MINRLSADRHVLVHRGEPQHFHLDVPHTGRKIQRVAAVGVGEADHFLIALRGGDGGPGNELVGGPY